MKRLRGLLADLWYHRPVLTTFARYDERGENGYARGLAEATDHAVEIYRAGYDAGSGTNSAPKPPCPRHGPASRMTSTGRSLVAVGP